VPGRSEAIVFLLTPLVVGISDVFYLSLLYIPKQLDRGPGKRQPQPVLHTGGVSTGPFLGSYHLYTKRKTVRWRCSWLEQAHTGWPAWSSLHQRCKFKFTTVLVCSCEREALSFLFQLLWLRKVPLSFYVTNVLWKWRHTFGRSIKGQEDSRGTFWFIVAFELVSFSLPPSFSLIQSTE
jgi:hypothetical protein